MLIYILLRYFSSKIKYISTVNKTCIHFQSHNSFTDIIQLGLCWLADVVSWELEDFLLTHSLTADIPLLTATNGLIVDILHGGVTHTASKPQTFSSVDLQYIRLAVASDLNGSNHQNEFFWIAKADSKRKIGYNGVIVRKEYWVKWHASILHIILPVIKPFN